MKFDIDYNLRTVVRAMAEPKPVEKVAVELCRRMIDEGIIEDCESNYGVKAIEAFGEKSLYHVIYVLLDYLGVTHISCEVYDAFRNARLMGEGNCPHCGGKLEFDYREHEVVERGNYDHEDVTEAVNYYVCQTCGKTHKTYEEL